MNPIIESIKEQSREATKEILIGAFVGLKDVVVDMSYSIALIGGGLSIVLYVAGWTKGKRWTSLLVVGYTLIKYLLG
ncbi:hypothetical protein [Paenibacillus wynnii]|uniref:Uncharacterized protein n=1 Tax=Paenibacillus wynnii TaxID=268407 RepID=A0A098M2N8_9BACL|nr:hypothetical protein [Paenibacillus wynnii]KGE16246.1 hypothetical protein PWYN_15915 [Paenibacillus wynnii]